MQRCLEVRVHNDVRVVCVCYVFASAIMYTSNATAAKAKLVWAPTFSFAVSTAFVRMSVRFRRPPCDAIPNIASCRSNNSMIVVKLHTRVFMCIPLTLKHSARVPQQLLSPKLHAPVWLPWPRSQAGALSSVSAFLVAFLKLGRLSGCCAVFSGWLWRWCAYVQERWLLLSGSG